MRHVLRLAEGQSSSSPKVVITMPAYNAEATLAKTIADIPPGVADQLILVDDASPDNTAQLARDLGVDVHVHPQNRGYGGNQKTCYTMALESRADVVVMLHPDYQYEPRAVPLLIAPILAGDADMTFGSRFAGLSDPRAGGMPLLRYVGNRVTTVVENVMLGSRFSEMHSGMRAYTRRCLLSIPFLRYSDGFLFDSQFLIDAVTSGQRVVEVPIPTRYTEESSSIGTLRSVSYVTRSVAYCVRRVLIHGRRGHRAPVGRRDASVPATKAPRTSERGCVLCGGIRPHRSTGDGQFRECAACGLVSSPRPPGGAGPSRARSATELPPADWIVDAVGGYAVPGRRMHVLGRWDPGLARAARAAGWHVSSTGTSESANERGSVDALLLLALPVDPLELPLGLAGLRAGIGPEGLLALVAPITRPAHPPLRPGVPYALRASALDEALRTAGFRLVEWTRLPCDVARDYLRWLSAGASTSATGGAHQVAFAAARPEDSAPPGDT